MAATVNWPAKGSGCQPLVYLSRPPTPLPLFCPSVRVNEKSGHCAGRTSGKTIVNHPTSSVHHTIKNIHLVLSDPKKSPSIQNVEHCQWLKSEKRKKWQICHESDCCLQNPGQNKRWYDLACLKKRPLCICANKFANILSQDKMGLIWSERRWMERCEECNGGKKEMSFSAAPCKTCKTCKNLSICTSKRKYSIKSHCNRCLDWIVQLKKTWGNRDL